MQCCNEEMYDTDLRGLNYLCSKCHKRFYRGKWYTPEEWFFFINEHQFEEQMEFDFESPHAHEQINGTRGES
jgi:hypothetical protein